MKNQPQSARPRLAVVGVEAGLRDAILTALGGQGASLEVASNLADLHRRHALHPFAVVIVDARLVVPGEAARLGALRTDGAPLEVILVAASNRATAGPVADVVETPIVPARLRAAVDRALERHRLHSQVDGLRARLREVAPTELVGQSGAMAALRQRVEALAAMPDEPVLVVGAAGTGKELVARSIHDRSCRRDAPFVTLNCAGLDEPSLDAALFGDDPAGSARREGALSGHGTVYLDEVGALSHAAQERLARLLADRAWHTESGQGRPLRCRVIAASRTEPAWQGAAERLAWITLRLPALADRAEDVPLLAQYFLAQLGRQLGKSLTGFSPEALETLSEQAWPHNVRELRNAVELAAMRCRGGLIEEEHLPRAEGPSGTDDVIPRDRVDLPTGDRSLRAVEKVMVGRVLDETHWNISKAAALLGINRTTLYNKIKLYSLGQRPLERSAPKGRSATQVPALRGA